MASTLRHAAESPAVRPEYECRSDCEECNEGMVLRNEPPVIPVSMVRKNGGKDGTRREYNQRQQDEAHDPMPPAKCGPSGRDAVQRDGDCNQGQLGRFACSERMGRHKTHHRQQCRDCSRDEEQISQREVPAVPRGAYRPAVTAHQGVAPTSQQAEPKRAQGRDDEGTDDKLPDAEVISAKVQEYENESAGYPEQRSQYAERPARLSEHGPTSEQDEPAREQ